MQCITPMFRLYEIETNKTVRIVPRQEVMQELEYNPNALRYNLDRMNSIYRIRGQKIQTIPCGHCVACNLNKSAEWATRCMLETLNYPNGTCHFVTLTYNDENLPILSESKLKIKHDMGDHYEFEEVTFENDGTWVTGTLWPDHVTKFLNSLRKHYERLGVKGIKFYMAGEYGHLNLRPHYHLILFGVPLDPKDKYDIRIDKKFFTENYKNKVLKKLWPYGFHEVSDVSWSNCAYVSRYTAKKLFQGYNTAWDYAKIGKEPEYTRMSRRPGIGMSYYQKHKLEIYKNDEMVMKTIKGNTGSFKPPKAFDKLFKEEFPEEWEKIEKRRKECAERSRKNLYYLSNYTDKEMNEIKAESIETKANMLVREL